MLDMQFKNKNKKVVIAQRRKKRSFVAAKCDENRGNEQSRKGRNTFTNAPKVGNKWRTVQYLIADLIFWLSLTSFWINCTSPPFTAISLADLEPPDFGQVGSGRFSVRDLGPSRNTSLSKKGGLHMVKSYCWPKSIFPRSIESGFTFTKVT